MTMPSAAPGDSGEHVTALQEQLQHLGYFAGHVDGHYGPDTEAAVRQVQEAAGQHSDGHVTEETWQAIEHLAAAGAHPQVGQLSPDGHWRWDGTDWQRYVAYADLIKVPHHEPEPDGVNLPDWYWHDLPAARPEPSMLSRASAWLNESLGTHNLASVAADVAGALGFDQAKVRHMLDEAFAKGGEAALKGVLRQAIAGATGRSADDNPFDPAGPPVESRPITGSWEDYQR